MNGGVKAFKTGS